MGWKTKCFVDTLKAPAPGWARHLKDRLFGYQRNPQKDSATITQVLDMIRWVSPRGKTVLEIGTGWQPLLPLLYSLAGASIVYTADLHKLLRPMSFRAALDAIAVSKRQIVSGLSIQPEMIDDVVSMPWTSLRECLLDLRIRYLAPCDCRSTPLPSQSVDIVVSRAVLEHIPPPVVAGIFAESRRLIRLGGATLHLIDHSDHWSHHDKSITSVNFLRYSDFSLTCVNPQNYQNRLRHPEYVDMLVQAGFVIERVERIVDDVAMAALRHMQIAKRFSGFSAQDLATTSSTVLATVK